MNLNPGSDVLPYEDQSGNMLFLYTYLSSRPNYRVSKCWQLVCNLLQDVLCDQSTTLVYYELSKVLVTSWLSCVRLVASLRNVTALLDKDLPTGAPSKVDSNELASYCISVF